MFQNIDLKNMTSKADKSLVKMEARTIHHQFMSWQFLCHCFYISMVDVATFHLAKTDGQNCSKDLKIKTGQNMNLLIAIVPDSQLF